jgi:hypothetical protein
MRQYLLPQSDGGTTGERERKKASRRERKREGDGKLVEV